MGLKQNESPQHMDVPILPIRYAVYNIILDIFNIRFNKHYKSKYTKENPITV